MINRLTILVLFFASLSSQAYFTLKFDPPLVPNTVDGSAKCKELCAEKNAVNLGNNWDICMCGMPLGGLCSSAYQCAGGPSEFYTGLLFETGQPGVWCCEGKCQKKVKDRAGIFYCPHECTGTCTENK